MTNPLKIIQGTKIYIGLPAYDHKLSTWTHTGLMRLRHVCTAFGIELTEDIHVNNSLIQIARNKIVRHFLQTDATHLVFIDNDVGFFGDDVLKLIGHNVDIVGGVYPRKMIIWENIRDAIKQNPDITNEELEWVAIDYPFKPLKEDGSIETTKLVEVKGLPTGFLCIKREVFEKMFEHMRSFLCNGEELREFFHVDMHGVVEIERDGTKVMIPEHISEDFWFCKKAQEHGFKILLDPTLNLIHHGSHTFKGSLSALAKLDEYTKSLRKS